VPFRESAYIFTLLLVSEDFPYRHAGGVVACPFHPLRVEYSLVPRNVSPSAVDPSKRSRPFPASSGRRLQFRCTLFWSSTFFPLIFFYVVKNEAVCPFCPPPPSFTRRCLFPAESFCLVKQHLARPRSGSFLLLTFSPFPHPSANHLLPSYVLLPSGTRFFFSPHASREVFWRRHQVLILYHPLTRFR